MDFAMIVSEEKIKKAYKDGELERLPGYGKPLMLDDVSGIPEDLRMAYRLMKNAGYAPEENALRQEVMTIENLIRNCQDPEEIEGLNRKLSEKLLRYNGLMSKRGAHTNSAVFKNYRKKIENKLL
ncbi:DnaJ family domain-containing protein [Bacillus sp. FJAT-27251]|uniref:DnaJ family domain-containing protein n=1 Tax=Bacillus sp. FJAT-27251 TaxID=1684142 RepID=UPI0006A7A24D|nr:DnaJ family domain-containing protein [Bacillus sp. FJAT-27251]